MDYAMRHLGLKPTADQDKNAGPGRQSEFRRHSVFWFSTAREGCIGRARFASCCLSSTRDPKERYMRIIASVLIAVFMSACGNDDPTPVPYVAPPSPCALSDEGLFRCAGASLQQCENGKWKSEENCLPGTCNSVTLSCEGAVGCTAGTQRCNGTTNSVEVCGPGGTWATATACGALTCVQAGITASCQASCTIGEQQCANNTVQTCSAAGWLNSTPCGGQTCVETGATAACQTVACTTGNTRCNVNTLQTCSGGGWIDVMACGAQTCVTMSSTSATCQTTCTLGDQQCNNGAVETCNGTTYAVTQICPNVCVDLGSTAYCDTPTCTNGYKQCVDNAVQTCTSGEWTTTQSCGTQTCTESGNTASCVSVSTSCTQASGEYSVCSGTEIVGCNGTTETGTYDCGAFVIGEATYAGWCWRFAGGAVDCVVPLGTPCSLTDGGENEWHQTCGTAAGPSANMGCHLEDGCVMASACNPDAFNFVCNSFTDMIVGCDSMEGSFYQSVIADCSWEEWGGGTCSSGSCWNTDAGDPCTAGVDYIPIQCQSPLACSTTEGAGTCGL